MIFQPGDIVTCIYSLTFYESGKNYTVIDVDPHKGYPNDPALILESDKNGNPGWHFSSMFELVERPLKETFYK